MQYLKIEGRDEHFLHEDKHEFILQVDTINLGGCGQAFLKLLTINFAKSLQYYNKEVRDEVDF